MPHSPKPFSLKFVVTPAIVTPVEEIICASRRVITEAECEIAVTKLCLWPHDQPETSMLLHTHYSSPLLLSIYFPLLLSSFIMFNTVPLFTALSFAVVTVVSIIFVYTFKKNKKNVVVIFIFIYSYCLTAILASIYKIKLCVKIFYFLSFRK